VSEDQIQEFYERHSDRFILRHAVVKARFMSIPSDTPNLKMMQKKMASDDIAEVMEADSMAYLSAFKFTTWDDAWIDASTLAKEFGADYSSVLPSIKKGWIERTDTNNVKSLAYVSEIIPAGKMAPGEYSAPFIKDMIISARKQSLLSTLEQDLLKDARENGQFVIY
jgi:hypothetical protein